MSPPSSSIDVRELVVVVKGTDEIFVCNWLCASSIFVLTHLPLVYLRIPIEIDAFFQFMINCFDAGVCCLELFEHHHLSAARTRSIVQLQTGLGNVFMSLFFF